LNVATQNSSKYSSRLITATSIQQKKAAIELTEEDGEIPFPLGHKFDSQTRTLTAGECAILTSLTWTTSPVHTDRDFALTTEFGELILAGAVVVAIAAGLLLTTSIYRDFESAYGVRFLTALDANAKFIAPVRFGDSIHLEVTLVDSRRSSSRPGCYVLVFEDHVVRQDEVIAASLQRHVLVETVQS
jgi:acyl dehydratase